MKAILRAIACLSCACLAHASEIVAWKVPLASYSWRHSGPENQIRLTKPPEASLFFHPGDELWDLNQLPQSDRIETDPPLEWVVWNATTSTLVTKSDWNGIWQLHQQLHVSSLPKLCRVTLEAFNVPKDGAPPSDERAPTTKVSFVSRFQQKSEVNSATETESAHATIEPSIGEDRFDRIDLRLDATIQVPAQPKLELTTNLVLNNDRPMWIARDFDGKDGLDLRVHARVETTSGTPFQDVMILQTGNKYKSLLPLHNKPTRHRLTGNRWLCLIPVSMEELADLDSEQSNKSPLAEPAPNQPKSRPSFTEVDAIKALRPWVGAKALDLNSVIKNTGITIKPEDFAGYDPIGGYVFFYSDSEHALDEFETLFRKLECCRPQPLRATFESNTMQTHLASSSGSIAHLIRTGAGNKVLKTIETEPRLGANGSSIDLRFHFECNGETGTTRLNSATTLAVGQFQNLMDGSDGKPLLRARAEIIRP